VQAGALALAAESLTGTDIAQRLALNAQRAHAIGKTFRCLRYLAGAGAIMAILVANPGELSWTTNRWSYAGLLTLGGLGGLVLSHCALFLLEAVLRHYWAHDDESEQLAPLAGSRHCDRALKYLQTGGPAVTQWRDVALAERGQLHIFDCQIMAALAMIYQDAQQHAIAQASAQERRERREAVCRQVHGIDPLPTPTPDR
jgi:hypothetical protein